MSENIQNLIERCDQIVHDAMGSMSIREKYSLWQQFHILSKTLEFDIRSTQLNCIVYPVYHATEGWHLSTCVYPSKGDCSCRYTLAHPTFYFAREKVKVSQVLNRGIHWDYCPLSKIACDDLWTLDASKQMTCECLVDMNRTKDQQNEIDS